MYTSVFSYFVCREKWAVGQVASENKSKWPLSTRVIVSMVGPDVWACQGIKYSTTLQQVVCMLGEEVPKSMTEALRWEERMLP